MILLQTLVCGWKEHALEHFFSNDVRLRMREFGELELRALIDINASEKISSLVYFFFLKI